MPLQENLAARTGARPLAGLSPVGFTLLANARSAAWSGGGQPLCCGNEYGARVASTACHRFYRNSQEIIMLYTIAVVLLVLWLL